MSLLGHVPSHQGGREGGPLGFSDLHSTRLSLTHFKKKLKKQNPFYSHVISWFQEGHVTISLYYKHAPLHILEHTHGGMG